MWEAEAGTGLLWGVGFGFELCQAQVSLSCVTGSSVPASGPGPSFLAGLVLTARHPPYLKLVISFLFISAAIQVPLALALAILPCVCSALVSRLHQPELGFNREKWWLARGLGSLVQGGERPGQSLWGWEGQGPDARKLTESAW